MSRRNKNIVFISTVVILIVSLVCTFYFGCNYRHKNISANEASIVEKNNTKSKSTEYNSTKKNDKSIDKSEEIAKNEEKANTEETEEGKIKNRGKENKSKKISRIDKNKSIIKSGDITSKAKLGSRMSIKYVGLISLESLLLGGTIVLLIFNNISDKNIKKSKMELI